MEFTALFSLSLLLFGLVSQVTAGRSLEIALQLSKHWLPHLRWRTGGLWVPRASCWRPPPAQWPAGLQSRADSQLLVSGLKILNNLRPPLFSLSSVPSSNYLSITDWEHWTYKKLDWESRQSGGLRLLGNNRSQTGRVLSGSQERRCGDNGAWTNQLPLCSEFRKILHCAAKIYKLQPTLLFASLLSAVRQLRSPQTRSSANCLGDMKQYKRERAQFARYSELWFLIWIRFGSHCRYQKNL